MSACIGVCLNVSLCVFMCHYVLLNVTVLLCVIMCGSVSLCVVMRYSTSLIACMHNESIFIKFYYLLLSLLAHFSHVAESFQKISLCLYVSLSYQMFLCVIESVSFWLCVVLFHYVLQPPLSLRNSEMFFHLNFLFTIKCLFSR